MPLFQKSVLEEFLKEQDSEAVTKAYKKLVKYFHNSAIQQNIRDSKEEQFQQKFLIELFDKVFSYTIFPDEKSNLTTEFKNLKGAKKADGAILIEGKAIAVVELKGTKTKDLESIRQQAFDYKSNHPSCIYIITSNFEKLRFYIKSSDEHLEFNLFTLTKEEFKLMYLCLFKENIFKHIPLKLKEDSLQEEKKITKRFYDHYSLFKRELFRDLVKQNMKNEVFRFELNNNDTERANRNIKQHLFKKSQKLIDRFLFIFFAEDTTLLPSNSTKQILNKWKADMDFGDVRPLYNLFKQYFNFLDTGRKGTESRAEIFAYNGGLFIPDPVLDSLIIDNNILFKHTDKLQEYDFDSQVDVNILGHIFENSLNEIESINAEIEGTEFDKQKTKRKKDGVFYTPKYITKYIVDNTVGKLCEEKKQELDINEEEYHKSRKGRKTETLKKLKTKLDHYRRWLLTLTVLDPACGSGAFLNQALDFLIKEHIYIDELETSLVGGGMVMKNIENTILENNIYGVDLNEESVEIAKLSLWLRTAQPRRKLNTLNKNIKCGNSLIDSKAVAGDKAFNWQNEFPHIFSEKTKKAWHITTATYNSRYSQRMFDNNVKPGDAIWIDEKDELIITKTIGEIVKKDNLNVIEYNICGDHMHLLLVCEEEELTKVVGKIKSMTARARNIAKGYTTKKSESDTTRGHAPLSVAGATDRGETQTKLWTQKFGKSEIKDENYLNNTIDYIKNNRVKHELPKSKEIEKLKKEFLSSVKHSFRIEYNGGFDVVIGNPPYVRAELLGKFQEYLSQNYSLYNPSGDLFSYFYEKSFKLLKADNGLFGFISNTFDKTTAGISIRKYLQTEISILKYIDFTEVQIFEGATTYPIILIAENCKKNEYNFKYIKIPKNSQSAEIDIDTEQPILVTQNSLDNDSWNFNSIDKSKLLSKITQNKTIREQYGKCFYGIKTGFNEAFIIDKTTKVKLEQQHESSKELIKPFYEGKDILKWNSPLIEKYIIFTRRGTVIDNFPAIKSYLEQFKERLTPKNSSDIKIGRKKGPYKWFEIQDSVDYYKLFEEPKITWANLQSRNKFSFEKEAYYINAPSVILPSNNKTLLCIVNSKLVWEFLKSICVVRSGGYIEVKPQYFEQIPIPELKNEEVFNIKAKIIIEQTSILQKLQSNFIKLLRSKFNIEKVSKSLQNWSELDFKIFLKELKKSKIKLSLSEEAEWMEYFNEQKAEAQSLKAEIDKTDKEIDQMVYKLYGLTEDEIKLIEKK